MKKVTLFLSIIGVAFLMTSCLGDGETSYSGTPLSYITRSESNVTYARTLDGLPITSALIQLENPGSFVFIAYSWSESQNTMTEEGIYNATVSDISDPIEQTTLISGDAPELETELPLASFEQALYGGVYFDYHWICTYGYEEGNGVKKRLKFYHNIEEGSENEIIIDVRLEDATGSVDKDQANIPVAVNLKTLNDYYSTDLSSGTSKTVQVYFRYYREQSDESVELYKTSAYNMSIVKE